MPSNTTTSKSISSSSSNQKRRVIPRLVLLGVTALFVLFPLHQDGAIMVLLARSSLADETPDKHIADCATASPRSSNNNNTATELRRKLTLIVELRGEMGNQLSVLANARITQLLGAQAGLDIELVGQHQNHPKWTRGRGDLVRCFPELRRLEFEGGVHDPAFDRVRAMQEAWLATPERRQPLVNVRNFSRVQELLDQQAKGEAPVIVGNHSRYSLPYLTATSFSFWDVVQHEDLYHDLRHWLRLDEAACCQQVPEGDEIVFHHRNFMAELKDGAWGNHFTEVTPETTANFLFGDAMNHSGSRNNATSSDNTRTTTPRVAIISRITDGLEPYVTALRARGMEARLITGQTGVQDFCFAATASHEFVGQYQSTFARFAALLGNTTVNRFYKLDQRTQQERQEDANATTTQAHRIVNVVERGDRSFVVEEIWQPDEHDKYKQEGR